MKISRFIFLFLLFPVGIWAQSRRQYDEQFHAWYVLMGNHRITSKWGVHTELQFRRAGIITPVQQHLARMGADFRVNDNFILTAGYCYVYTGSYGKQPAVIPFNEHRAWQQILLTHSTGSLSFQHRYRQENRWIERYNSTLLDNEIFYVNRFRYRFQVTVSLNSTHTKPGTLFMTLNDELWVNFGKQVRFNVFDQNRAYAGLGYRINKTCNVQLGYLNQLIFKSDGIHVEKNQTLQFALFCNLDFRKAEE